MGYGHWSGDAYDHLKKHYSTKSTNDIFTSNKTRSIAKGFNPFGLQFRESRDSDKHPNSLAISVYLDVTGSMGKIPDILIRHKLGSLMDTLLNHDIEDPQIMFSAIGDHISDQAPLQVGQFESSTDALSDGLTKIFLEGGGGGQNMESYLLAWLVAGRHTSIDCFEKRGKKGFLFTIGDEKTWGDVSAAKLKAMMGYKQAHPITAKEVLAQAQRMYNVYHIHINETGYKNNVQVLDHWRNLLGENLLILDKHEALAELIASTIAVMHGVKLDTLVADFDKGIARSVEKALVNFSPGPMKHSDTGILEL